MAPKEIIFNGAKFIPNNYSSILSKAEAPSKLHFIQDFLANSDIGSGVYDNGGAQGTPSIIFTIGEDEHAVTLATIRQALQLPENKAYTTVEEPILQNMMTSLGYERTLAKLGQLKRPYIRREWSFFFDCITKAFTNKCSNFDAIPISSQQIGYALINQTDFDYASVVLGFIGDRMTEDRNTVYFARFCQLIYSFCCDDKPQSASELIPSFRLAKRAFNDLLSTDNKKNVLRPLFVPLSVKQALITYDPVKYTALYPDVQPSEPQPSSPTTSTQTPQTSQPSAQTTRPSSFKPSKKTKSVPQPPQKRRKMILRDESESEEETVEARVHASEPVIIEAENVTSQDEKTAQSSDTLKRKSVNSDAAETTPSLARRLKKMKARRYLDKAISEHTEEAEEGDQESLISQEPIIIEALPAQAKDTTNDTVVTPHTPALEINSANQNLDDVIPESPVTSHTVELSEQNESSSSDVSVSVKTLVPTLGKEELVKKFVKKEAPIPWEDTHRGVEWTKKWNKSDFIPCSKVLTEHIVKADKLLTNADFKTQLKITALSTKHLQGLHTSTHENVDTLREKDDKLDLQIKLDKNRKLNWKNGDKVVKSKCSPIQELKKKDDKDNDQGNSEKSRGQRKVQGKSSIQNKSSSDASGSEDSQKFLQTLKLKGKQTNVYYKDPKIQTLDEEIARRLFLKYNLGMDLETLEEEARFAAEKTNPKTKASDAKKPPRPKEKAIVIKEKSISEASKAKTRSQIEIDSKSKGKEKVEDENVQTLKRKKISEESKTTSDKAQVVQSEEVQVTEEAASSDKVKKSTTDSAQVDLDKMEVTDKRKLVWKNVKPSDPKKSQLLSTFMTIGLNAREPRDRAGLDITQKHLNKVISIQLVPDAHDKHNIKENLILFLDDGRTFQIKKSHLCFKDCNLPDWESDLRDEASQSYNISGPEKQRRKADESDLRDEASQSYNVSGPEKQRRKADIKLCQESYWIQIDSVRLVKVTRTILTNRKYQFLLESGLTGSQDLKISGLRLSEDNIRRWISELKYWRTNS
ncbi:hypothetical protein AgCh_022547 [Apium graveolens]